MWGKGHQSHYARDPSPRWRERGDFGMTEGMGGKGISLTMREYPRPAGENAGTLG